MLQHLCAEEIPRLRSHGDERPQLLDGILETIYCFLVHSVHDRGRGRTAGRCFRLLELSLRLRQLGFKLCRQVVAAFAPSRRCSSSRNPLPDGGRNGSRFDLAVEFTSCTAMAIWMLHRVSGSWAVQCLSLNAGRTAEQAGSTQAAGPRWRPTPQQHRRPRTRWSKQVPRAQKNKAA